jgi:hypothetical protein
MLEARPGTLAPGACTTSRLGLLAGMFIGVPFHRVVRSPL